MSEFTNLTYSWPRNHFQTKTRSDILQGQALIRGLWTKDRHTKRKKYKKKKKEKKTKRKKNEKRKNKIRDLFKVKLNAIRSETNKREKEGEKEKKREREIV